MIKCYCDRCKEEIEYRTYKKCSVTIYGEFEKDLYVNDLYGYNLCKSCRNELIKWINPDNEVVDK